MTNCEAPISTECICGFGCYLIKVPSAINDNIFDQSRYCCFDQGERNYPTRTYGLRQNMTPVNLRLSMQMEFDLNGGVSLNEGPRSFMSDCRTTKYTTSTRPSISDTTLTPVSHESCSNSLLHMCNIPSCTDADVCQSRNALCSPHLDHTWYHYVHSEAEASTLETVSHKAIRPIVPVNNNILHVTTSSRTRHNIWNYSDQTANERVWETEQGHSQTSFPRPPWDCYQNISHQWNGSGSTKNSIDNKTGNINEDGIEKLNHANCIERNTYLNQEDENEKINIDDCEDSYNWQSAQKCETSHQPMYSNNRIYWKDVCHRTSLESDNFSETFGSTGPNGTESRYPKPYQLTCKHKQANVCFLCTRVYARPSTLKTHLRTHSGLRPYPCMHCHKKFSQAANLTAHLRTHSGERPFQCPVCFRCFSQSSSVTTHLRTHSGEKPYTCRVCSKAFADSSTLTKHARVHSGEKPYKCSLCDVRFSQSGNLKRHRRLHMTKEQSVYIKI